MSFGVAIITFCRNRTGKMSVHLTPEQVNCILSTSAVFAGFYMLQCFDYEERMLERRRLRWTPRQRRCWVRPWLGADRRLRMGHYHQLMSELRLEDPATFKNFVRVEPAMFDEIVDRLSPRIQKRDTNYRKSIEPAMKVAITLRHLATGINYTSLAYDFRVAQNTISILVKEVCQAIKDEYVGELIKCPQTPAEWKQVAADFERKWNVPHALGALDGKHVRIKKPHKSGSYYYNYKGFFSVVLMGLVDADYKFLWVDTGGFGHMSDTQIFNNTDLKEGIDDETIGFPPPEKLPNDDKLTPYFILGDDIFALRTWLMTPYSIRGLTHQQRIFNYRLSRGRRVVENAFGILAQRWSILLTAMLHTPSTIRLIVEACILLHNLMRIRYPTLQNACLDKEDDNHDLIPGTWRASDLMASIGKVKGATRASTKGKRQRVYLTAYFNSEAGSVPWQDDMV